MTLITASLINIFFQRVAPTGQLGSLGRSVPFRAEVECVCVRGYASTGMQEMRDA